MNTFHFEILKAAEGCYRVTEANGPSAPATGEYDSLDEAQAAVARFAGVGLDWESGISEGDEQFQYWVAEFSR